MVLNFAQDSCYALVHFNHGLHGAHMSKRTYKSLVKKLTDKLAKNSKIVLATSTLSYEEGNKVYNKIWHPLVKSRNAAVQELAIEKGYAIDDLFAVSKTIGKEKRAIDGFHYTHEGYEIFANAVSACIKENI